MSKPLVINIFGAPGAGKSTLRAGLFYKLKLAGINIEESPEWIKAKVYEDNQYVGKDQLYVFSKQRKSLNQMIGKVGCIITDSPMLVSLVYGDSTNKIFTELVLDEFNKCDNINILLVRNHDYVTTGRYQNEEEAKDIHLKIKSILDNNGIIYKELPSTTDLDTIANYVKAIIDIYQGTNKFNEYVYKKFTDIN